MSTTLVPTPTAAITWLRYDHNFSASVQAGLFGHLVKLATQQLKCYHGDLFHDAAWITEHVQGPEVFFWGVDESGTAIGYDRDLVRQARKIVWRVELLWESGNWSVALSHPSVEF